MNIFMYIYLYIYLYEAWLIVDGHGGRKGKKRKIRNEVGNGRGKTDEAGEYIVARRITH